MTTSTLHFPSALILSLQPLISRLTWEDLALRVHYDPQALAQICHVSIRTLQRHFRKHHRTTLTHWLRDCRMAEAHRRILAGASIKEVFMDLGFKQASHFTRVFREHFGITPSFLRATQPLLPLFSGRTASRARIPAL